MKRFLICTDLDRTLIPNGAEAESPEALGRFKRLVARDEITLAYVTGRHRALIEQAIAEFDLPMPDFAIADVGSTIYRVSSQDWEQLDEWDAHIAPDWNGYSHQQLDQLLRVSPLLSLQEPEKQNRHKLSFYTPRDADVQTLVDQMKARLTATGIKVNLIWSVDEQAGMGLLDVLPARANKRHAIEFLMKSHGYLFENTVFSGDSGNDFDVLRSEIPAVLVANADAQIKRQLNEELTETERASVYVAKGGYLGMNGNYSAGILEGVAHYLPEVDVWLREES